MPLNVPTLDDRTYEDLVREGIELLPGVAPEWTNYNASDPGVTLLELFAYLTEIYLYRIDRVSNANKAKFVTLLVGSDPSGSVGHVDDKLHEAIVGLRGLSRAVSASDFEQLALEAVREHGYTGSVARVHCYSRRNFEAPSAAERQLDRPGHMSVVVVPVDPHLAPTEIAAVARAIEDHLEPRRLITSRVHVVPPRYIDVSVRIRAAVASSRAAALEQKIRRDVDEQYRTWPLGRSVFAADLYRRLSSIQGVLQVSSIEWSTSDRTRLLRSESGDVVGVHLEDGELPRVSVSDVTCDVSG